MKIKSYSLVILMVFAMFLFGCSSQSIEDNQPPEGVNESDQQVNLEDLHVKSPLLVEDLTTFDIKALKDSGKPVIINFTLADCPPCLDLKPLLEETAEDYSDKVTIKLIDLRSNFEFIRDNYKVQSVPAVVVFDSEGRPFDFSKLGLDYKSLDMVDGLGNTVNTTMYVGSGLTESKFRVMLQEIGVEVQ